jgi:two-component system, chemotaxis family, CheB/CheR fusion protein
VLESELPTTPPPEEAADPRADAVEARPTPESFHIVGVGASAGGLESLERFFARVPPDTGMAFVVLQHLSPDFKSLMDELLSRHTRMPIRHAEHEMLVEPNTIYLLPPMKEMIVRQRRLLLSDRDPRSGLTLPIDLFLRSLAHDVGEQAVAVILSGSGSDGSRGVQEISKAGGTVLCESPDTAQFNGMPLSAIRTGLVEHVLPPDELAGAVAALASPDGEPTARREAADDERGVDVIMRLLRDEYGIDFTHYKASTVSRRIERRLALNRSIDIDMYVEQLRSDPRELSSLYEDLLIGVTRFFRDEMAFQALEHRVVPDIVDRVAPEEQIRVWVPGCATGQEAYSIAMLFHERLVARRRPLKLKILATDVHKTSLDLASTGIYTAEQVQGVGRDRLKRFFTRRPEGYQVSQALRESIVFAPHNLIRDAPFTKMDLIACRNLLIYFQPHAQKTVLTLFHFALKPGGVLFLGSSESPGGLLDEFDTLDEQSKLFRKRRDLGLPRDVRLPLPRSTTPRAPFVPPARRSAVSPHLLSAYDRLLDRFMPPSFLVDDHGTLVDTFGGVESLLNVKARRPSQNLLDLVTDDLRVIISGALHRVRTDLESVKYPAVVLPGQGRVSLVAEPVRDTHGTLTHILISLAPAEADTTAALVPPFADVPGARVEIEAPATAAATLGGLTRDQVQALEEELSYTKEHLQAAVEQHETANEELQATNEELIASNEELQSTNEELHSVNEEMYTVNAEYQRKNAELQELHDDIEHLLNGTDVATLFLDRQLCIRKFTPRIAETFRVIPQDVGRPLRAFTHDLDRPTLLADIERVLEEGATIEAQTWDRRGRCYFLRILPYRARLRGNGGFASSRLYGAEQPGAPEGVVLTLTDISALEQARARVAQLSAIVESSEDAIIGKTLEGVITAWNDGATRLYGYSAAEAVGRHASFLWPAERRSELDEVIGQVREGRSVERLDAIRLRKDGSLVHVSVNFSPIYDASGHAVGVSAIARDITQLVQAREEIAEREERIRLLLDSTAEAIYGIDLSGACTFCNAACARMLGYESPAALIGRQMHQLVHHTKPDGTPYAPERSPIFQAMRNREGTHVDDEVLWRADGTSFPAEYWSHPVLRDGEVIGAVVTFLDISERRRAEQEILEGVRRREQFIAMLSHELRNPLAAIFTATHVLNGEKWDTDACTEAGRVIARQAQHMTRLLDDLLDVARISHGRITLRHELVDLRDVARSALEAMAPSIAERQTQLTVDLEGEPVQVMGDPARLQQIQANLISNAVKYSAVQGVVRLEVRREGDQAVIRVTDRGRGIDPQVLPHIFDLFVQGDQSLARSEGGLGIGLSVLQSLVDLHGGRVDAYSEGPGLGSVFTVWLPLASPPSEADTRNEERTGAVRTVVLVEDQDDARRMLQLVMEAEGVRVFAAKDGLEGATLIEQAKPDLAFVDLGLPVMSGFELARRVRQNPELARTRLVALSGYGRDSDIRAAHEAGFDEHLTKPPDPARLEEMLRGNW